MSTKKVLFWVVAASLAVFSFAFLLYSCGGGGGGTPATGTVGLYLTDKPVNDMSGFKQVIATIDKVQLVNRGSGATCDVLTMPTTVNLANLANVMQLVNVTECTSGPFNRIHIEFDKSVQLMSAQTGTSACSFVSFKDEGHGNQPNTLNCSGPLCTLDINGAVNVLANQQNKAALDFSLKDFDVDNFDDPLTCSVTMKVSPLHGGEIEALRHPEAITGLISNLTTSTQTFDLTRGNTTFSVLYSGITATDQPGLDTLLQLAQTDGLRVRVMASNIDFMTRTITATKISVKIEGTVSSLDTTNHVFTLAFKGSNTIAVDYNKASVDGALADGARVQVSLYGNDGTNYLASKVEVEMSGMSTED
jgi:hypothetical protein